VEYHVDNPENKQNEPVNVTQGIAGFVFDLVHRKWSQAKVQLVIINLSINNLQEIEDSSAHESTDEFTVFIAKVLFKFSDYYQCPKQS